ADMDARFCRKSCRQPADEIEHDHGRPLSVEPFPRGAALKRRGGMIAKRHCRSKIILTTNRTRTNECSEITAFGPFTANDFPMGRPKAQMPSKRVHTTVIEPSGQNLPSEPTGVHFMKEMDKIKCFLRRAWPPFTLLSADVPLPPIP